MRQYGKPMITEDSIMRSASNGVYSCALGTEWDRESEDVYRRHLIAMEFTSGNISLEEFSLEIGKIHTDFYTQKKSETKRCPTYGIFTRIMSSLGFGRRTA
jgi:hypothetical protein